MLQQTSTERVAEKYGQFLKAFPGFTRLAAASVGEVLKAWKGLGYNRRALALRQAAQIIKNQHGGRVPRSLDELSRLPGIGKATASAILAFAFNIAHPFIETNIRRVFIHVYFPGASRVSDSRIIPLVEATLDRENPREWYSALMDYGASLAKGMKNPNRRSTEYARQPRFEGSDRQIRGRILQALLDEGSQSQTTLARACQTGRERIRPLLAALVDEGFLVRTGRRYTLR